MWFSVVETLALATGISVALLGGMPGSATPEYSITQDLFIYVHWKVIHWTMVTVFLALLYSSPVSSLITLLTDMSGIHISSDYLL